MSDLLYPYFVESQGRHIILVWFSDDSGDRFLKDGNALLVGDSKDSINQKLKNRAHLVKWSELATLNIDELFSGLDEVFYLHISDEIQSTLFLNGWNFFEDLIRTFALEKDFLEYRTPCLDKVYDKIFWGCNLPSVTPEGKSYSPIWTNEEVECWKQYMIALKGAFIPRMFSKSGWPEELEG